MRIGELSVWEKAGQLLFPRLGSNMPPPVRAAEDLERFERLLEQCPVGGLIVFNGSYPETPAALARLQQQSAIPLLVSADMERGVGQQIRGATVFPHARAFSAAGSEHQLELAARIQAREALASGIHITFSPVADVNRDTRNPIIATRAFGADPHEVARFVQAFIRGSHAEGLLTTAKHFPGHGNTSRDSHAELPIVESSRDDLEEFDLVPFRAAIEAGVDLVMSAHVVFPALDPERPSTLSPLILRKLLRNEMGFTGAVITDSLLMGAIRESHPDAGSQAAALVEAGVDILLDIPDPVAAAEGIVRAVEGGRLEIRLLDEAVSRVISLKDQMMNRHGERVFSDLQPFSGANEVGSDAHADAAHRVARSAVTTIDNSRGALPIEIGDANDDVLALVFKPHRTRLDPPEEPFGEAFQSAFPGGRYRQIDPEPSKDLCDEIRSLVSGSRLVILAFVVKPAAWHAFGLPPDQMSLAREIVATVPTIVVSLGSPYALEDFPEAAARLCSYSDVRASQLAVIDILAGHESAGKAVAKSQDV